MSIDWWWCEGLGYRPPPRRDPREDDPEYYKDWGGRWVKRTEWTLENYPSTSDWDTYCKFIQETSPAERTRLKHAYLTSQGLEQWARFPHIWTSPERVKELDAQYQAGRKRERENLARARAFSRYGDWWPWC